jgi:uncharacterized membrane protein YphA (DoxX/SURF4 family)
MAMAAVMTSSRGQRVVTIMRLVVGVIFLTAAIEKSVDVRTPIAGVMHLLAAQETFWPTLLTSTAIVSEAIVGVCLITGWRARTAALVGITLLGFFTAYAVLLVRSDFEGGCGCGFLMHALRGASEALTALVLANSALAATLCAIIVMDRAEAETIHTSGAET